MKKYDTIFLDRDGTINFDPGYINSLDDFKFYDFTFEATDVSMSIILPYYSLSNSLSVSNVEFTGDINEPASNGSLISPVNSTLLTLKEFDNG